MSTRFAAMAGTALLHGLAAAGLFHGASWSPAPAPAPGQVIQVRLVASASAPGASAPAAVPVAAGPAVPDLPPARAEVYYHFPHELDRELIPLRDRSGDADITLENKVVMDLFVDAQGRVVDIRFGDGAPSLLLQAQLKAAFFTLEFLPAQKGGRAVAARIRIELTPAQQLAGE